MSEGSISCIFGSPGSGKSHFATRTLAPRHCGPGRIVIYSTPSELDAENWQLGPVVSHARGIYDRPPPEAVLVRDDRGGALELVSQARATGYRVLYLVDEAHELWPERSTPTEELDDLHTIRHQSGLTVVAITQRPARLSKTLISMAEATGSIWWFRLSLPVDLTYLERWYGAAAALDVSRLGRGQYRELHRDRPLPPGWDGHLRSLERRAARERLA